jgi:hypothetical protein
VQNNIILKTFTCVSGQDKDNGTHILNYRESSQKIQGVISYQTFLFTETTETETETLMKLCVLIVLWTKESF